MIVLTFTACDQGAPYGTYLVNVVDERLPEVELAAMKAIEQLQGGDNEEWTVDDAAEILRGQGYEVVRAECIRVLAD